MQYKSLQKCNENKQDGSSIIAQKCSSYHRNHLINTSTCNLNLSQRNLILLQLIAACNFPNFKILILGQLLSDLWLNIVRFMVAYVKFGAIYCNEI